MTVRREERSARSGDDLDITAAAERLKAAVACGSSNFASMTTEMAEEIARLIAERYFGRAREDEEVSSTTQQP